MTRNREIVRADWMGLWGTGLLPLGADVNDATAFLAHGMLITPLRLSGFPRMAAGKQGAGRWRRVSSMFRVKVDPPR